MFDLKLRAYDINIMRNNMHVLFKQCGIKQDTLYDMFIIYNSFI